jgi:hypothetical protein
MDSNQTEIQRAALTAQILAARVNALKKELEDNPLMDRFALESVSNALCELCEMREHLYGVYQKFCDHKFQEFVPKCINCGKPRPVNRAEELANP